MSSENKTRYSAEELEEFKVIINIKLDSANEQLAYYLDQLKQMADSGDSKIRGMDDGNITAESERLSSMAGRQKKLIQHLNSAIIRIQNNTYGICRETGILISKERLKAVPHATLSIKAKSNQR